HWFVLALRGMENSPFEVTVTTPADLNPAMLRDQDAVVLLNTPSLPAAVQTALERYVSEEGGALWLAPGDRVSADGFNREFAALSPALLQSQQVLASNDYQLIADIDRRHPALRALTVDFGARFQGFWTTEPQPDAVVLMRFDSGLPMLI